MQHDSPLIPSPRSHTAALPKPNPCNSYRRGRIVGTSVFSTFIKLAFIKPTFIKPTFLKPTFLAASIINIAILLTGCADLNAPGGGGYRHDPYYGSGGYGSGGYGSGGYGSGGYDRGYDHPNGYGSGDFYREQERERLRRERYRLERDQERLERERREIERARDEERDRNRYPAQPPAYQPPAYQPPAYQPPAYQPPGAPPQKEERCPSGFSPSERKCTTEERRRGCKDMRLPGGLGCVHR